MFTFNWPPAWGVRLHLHALVCLWLFHLYKGRLFSCPALTHSTRFSPTSNGQETVWSAKISNAEALMSSELPFFTWLPTIYYLWNMWDNQLTLSARNRGLFIREAWGFCITWLCPGAVLNLHHSFKDDSQVKHMLREEWPSLHNRAHHGLHYKRVLGRSCSWQIIHFFQFLQQNYH